MLLTIEGDPDRETFVRLEMDGLVRLENGSYVPTPRWRSALARSATRLTLRGENPADIPLRIACALVELYGSSCPDEELALFIRVFTPIVEHEIAVQSS